MTKKKEAGPAGRFIGGCLLFFFGLPFAGMGGFVLFQGTLLLFGRNTVEMDGHPAVFIIMGAIFLVVGLAIIWGGLFGHKYVGRKRPKDSGFDDNWKTSKFFPKARAKRGSRGGFLLGTEASPFARFLGLTFFAAFWNGISWFALYHVWNDFGSSGFKYFPIIFIGFFCLIGLFVIGLAGHALLRCLLVGGTSLEIDRMPVRPGDRIRLTLRQKGDFEITSLTMKLICRETVRWRVGTNTHTSMEDVLSEVLHQGGNLRTTGSTPLVSCETSVPDDAMHSFKASNNQLGWGIEVTMDIPGRPDVKEFFEFRVIPESQR